MFKPIVVSLAMLSFVPTLAQAKDYSVAGSHAEIGVDENVDDLSVAGGTADVKAVVHGDVSVVAGGVVLRAPVEGDVSVVAGQVDIYSEVKGDVHIVAGKVNLHDGAKVLGKMRHMPGISDRDDDADASTGRNEVPEPPQPVRSALFSAVVFAIFGGLLRWLMPESGKRMVAMQTRPVVGMFVSGVATALLGILILLGLTVTIIGIPVMAMLVFGIAMAIPALIFVYSYGYLDSLVGPRGKDERQQRTLGILLRVGTALLLGALTQIPYGALLLNVLLLLAMGAAWTAWRERKTQRTAAPPSISSEIMISK